MNYQLLFTELGKGLLYSVWIFLLTLLFALPLGLGIALLRMSRNAILSWCARIYISVLRGTPLMLQLLMVYFGPYYIFKISIGGSYRFIAVVIAFSINYAAYFAEIYRAGIESIPIGQYEAAQVLGYSRFQTFFKIILPQALPHVMPSYAVEIISLIKATAIVGYIAVQDLTKVGDIVRR